jgi:hypothetical protein
MAKRHEMQASVDIVTADHFVVDRVEALLRLMQDLDGDGNPLLDDNGDPYSVDQLKQFVIDIAQKIPIRKNGTDYFIANRLITFDLGLYTSKSLQKVKDDMTGQDNHVINIRAEFNRANTKKKLRDLALANQNPFGYASPVNYDFAYQAANIINDFLDAASYVLRNIDFRNGNTTTLTDTEIKQQVSALLYQIPNYSGANFPADILDVQDMVDAANYVLAHINDTALLTLADYIDANVEKLPLMRRNWAV